MQFDLKGKVDIVATIRMGRPFRPVFGLIIFGRRHCGGRGFGCQRIEYEEGGCIGKKSEMVGGRFQAGLKVDT